jgi:hypothetical protein
MIRLAITRHYNVAFGCVEPVTAESHAPPVNGVWRLENTDYHGHGFTLYRVGIRSYRAYVDRRMLGFWRSKDIAMAATEWAALPQTSRREPAVSIGQLDVRERKREARQ